MAKRERLIASKLIDANRWRVHPQEAEQRFAERDARIAADNRSPAEKYLGDPPRHRSALAQDRNPRRGVGWRVDLWRK